ncbi:LOG family protein [Pseudomaricurvus sp. HS19]|uniref:LOG family protein n=1 Tax=Pseudomaricurvus sp. HS19 TaxID=2692626 RepID=UPI001367AB19|nr:3-isopropylmalate dehydrogenase [Pseudomaricurvus sp. HS19]
MKKHKKRRNIFPSARDDMQLACDYPRSTSYRLAFTDQDFLLRDELRAVRLQLEWLKPDMVQQEHGIESTVVVFGGARFQDKEKALQQLADLEQQLLGDPGNETLMRKLSRAQRVLRNSRYYDEARLLARRITEVSMSHGSKEYVVVTGGGPGVMEAANRGAEEAGGKSIGLNIVLPHEQEPNPYITPEFCFQFHYFAIRKMHFLLRAVGLIACPGGFGTLDELFETLTLIQTGRVGHLPVILLGREYWTRLIDFDFLVEQGAIDEEDLDLFHIVDSHEEAWQILSQAWELQSAE